VLLSTLCEGNVTTNYGGFSHRRKCRVAGCVSDRRSKPVRKPHLFRDKADSNLASCGLARVLRGTFLPQKKESKASESLDVPSL
jgi:hypothetical protein